MADHVFSQIDGVAMLCRVCGDKACGLHYGVHSCERCRRFFKRSIKHNAPYKPCQSNQQCSVLWHNRKKCNSCQLNKCIAVGMSKDVPKCGKSKTLTEKPNIHATKKKAKVSKNEMQEILSAMQKMRIRKCGCKITAPMKKSKLKISTSKKKVNIPEGKKSTIFNKSKASVQTMITNSPDEDLSAELEEDFNKLTASTKMAQEDICDLTKEKIAALSEKSRTHSSKSFSQPVGSLITSPYSENKGATYSKKELIERFATVIKGVIQHCKRIPWFISLPQCDQNVLLKAGVFEVLLVKIANNFTQDNALLCFNCTFLLEDSVETDGDEGSLCKSLHDFAKRMSKLHLSSIETNLFSYILLVAADHPGLRDAGQVMRLQNKLIGMLKELVYSNHTKNPNVFDDLLKMIPTVRILNCLHSKKFMTYEMEPGRKPETFSQIIEQISNEIMNRNENSSTPLDHPSVRNLDDHPSVAPFKEVNSSSGRQSGSSTMSYECSATDSIGDEILYPMCVEDSNSSLQTSSSSSSASNVHEDPGSSGTIQRINLVHEVRSAKADEPDKEVISEGEANYFDSSTKLRLEPTSSISV